MSGQNAGKTGNFWLVLAFVAGLAMVGQLGGCNDSGPASSTTSNNNSFEHRYVQERFKQEGYNAAESRQAADAVMRFHEAQQRRKGN